MIPPEWRVAATACFACLFMAAEAVAQCVPRQSAHLVATAGAASDYFGAAVALDRDTMVAGAYGHDDEWGGHDAGAARVFVRSGGVWREQATLLAPDAMDDDYFGFAVAISGDTAVIGAYGADAGTTADAGAAYVFIRSAGTWIGQAKLTAPQATANQWFGYSVSISAETAVIGAHQATPLGKMSAGAAYAFIRHEGVWSLQGELTAADGAPYDYFGRSVAIEGDTAIVGANGADPGGIPGGGSAYVFMFSAGAWQQQVKLTASDAAAYDNFGFSVDLSGRMAIVGSVYDDHSGSSNAGSAYVFERTGGTWAQRAKLIASDAAGSDDFGRSVALSAGIAVIGANQDDHAGGINAGSAYVFDLQNGAWVQQDRLSDLDAASSDHLGSSVALSGFTAVAGSPQHDVAGLANAGECDVFDLCPLPIPFDFDSDGDVDGADLHAWAACVSGPAVPEPPAGCVAGQFSLADGDRDGDVDQRDFGAAQNCYSGPGIPAAPDCKG